MYKYPPSGQPFDLEQSFFFESLESIQSESENLSTIAKQLLKTFSNTLLFFPKFFIMELFTPSLY